MSGTVAWNPSYRGPGRIVQQQGQYPPPPPQQQTPQYAMYGHHQQQGQPQFHPRQQYTPPNPQFQPPVPPTEPFFYPPQQQPQPPPPQQQQHYLPPQAPPPQPPPQAQAPPPPPHQPEEEDYTHVLYFDPDDLGCQKLLSVLPKIPRVRHQDVRFLSHREHWMHPLPVLGSKQNEIYKDKNKVLKVLQRLCKERGVIKQEEPIHLPVTPTASQQGGPPSNPQQAFRGQTPHGYLPAPSLPTAQRPQYYNTHQQYGQQPYDSTQEAKMPPPDIGIGPGGPDRSVPAAPQGFSRDNPLSVHPGMNAPQGYQTNPHVPPPLPQDPFDMSTIQNTHRYAQPKALNDQLGEFQASRDRQMQQRQQMYGPRGGAPPRY